MSSSSVPSLTGFKALSFDCYGTLIDYEAGIAHGLRPILMELPRDHAYVQSPIKAVQRLEALTTALQAREPELAKSSNMAACFRLLSRELGVEGRLGGADAAADAFGAVMGGCDAFPDTVEGLRRLAQRYKLVILSNVDHANMGGSEARMRPVRFDAVYTAQDIGSYKPALANFRYLSEHARDDLGVHADRGELLHVARSLLADHIPAKQVGLRSVWIDRAGDGRENYEFEGGYEPHRDEVAFEWKFDSIGAFADEVDRQFAEAQS